MLLIDKGEVESANTDEICRPVMIHSTAPTTSTQSEHLTTILINARVLLLRTKSASLCHAGEMHKFHSHKPESSDLPQ